MHFAFGQIERVEIGHQVAHDAVGADQHQSADAVLRRAEAGDRGQIVTGLLGARFDTAAQFGIGGSVVPSQCALQILVIHTAISMPRPRWSLAGLAIVHAGEELAPLLGHAAGIALINGLHLLDIGGVGAVEE